MIGRKRMPWTRLGALAVTVLLAAFLAACTSTSLHWITPVPSTSAPLPEEAAAVEPATVEPAAETPSAEAEASEAVTAEPTTEAAEEAGAETGDEEIGDELGDDGVASPITHALAEHEACTDCHEAGGERRGSPADHANLTDAVCVYCHMPEEGEAAIPPLPAKAETDFCLGCHGPHEELQARTADYVSEEGLAGNPHIYVPHDGTRILPCSSCHAVHELPVSAPETIEQAGVQYCFAACHHEEDFEPCSKCHNE